MTGTVPSQPLSVAIVGTGTWARVHVAAIRRTELARVALLVGSDVERTAQAAAELGVPRHATDIGTALMAGAIDVVHVCTTNDLHAVLSMAAVAAGKHVVVEKPLAIDAADARSVAGAAEAAGVHGMTAFTYRGLASIERARDLVEAGAIGSVRIVDGYYLQDWLRRGEWNWRLDAARGGASAVVFDIGVHWFDALEYITGRRIAAVFAELAHHRAGPGASTDTAIVLFRLDNGATGSVLLSQVYPGQSNDLCVRAAGDHASVTWDRELAQPSIAPAGIESTPLPPATSGRTVESPQDALAVLLARFYGPILAGHPPTRRGDRGPYPTLWDGYRACLIADAVVASARHHEWTGVPLDPRPATELAPGTSDIPPFETRRAGR